MALFDDVVDTLVDLGRGLPGGRTADDPSEIFTPPSETFDFVVQGGQQAVDRFLEDLEDDGLIDEDFRNKPPVDRREILRSIPNRELEKAARKQMVSYQDFIRIGLNKCGSDERTFSNLASLWSAEKGRIRGMSEQEIRDELNCP